MAKLPMEIHGYYFAEGSGALKGVFGSAIVSISGPFISFDPQTRLISDAQRQYYLPASNIETSPQLISRTTDQLKKLSNKITS
jgi:hypothetical protein